jgi:hypothetical protein
MFWQNDFGQEPRGKLETGAQIHNTTHREEETHGV